MIMAYDETYEQMEKLASNHHQTRYDKIARKNVLGAIEMDICYALSEQIATISK